MFKKVKNILNNNKINFVFLIQWANCIPYQHMENLGQTATFQLVLATDGVNSFAISNYPYKKSQIKENSFFPSQVGYYDGIIRAIYIAKNWLDINTGNQQQGYNLDQLKGNMGMHCLLSSIIVPICIRVNSKSYMFRVLPLTTINEHLHGRRQDFGSVEHFWASPPGMSGGGAPRTPDNFRKFSNIFLRKLIKLHYFNIFFEKLNKPCVIFPRLDEKPQAAGNY